MKINAKYRQSLERILPFALCIEHSGDAEVIPMEKAGLYGRFISVHPRLDGHYPTRRDLWNNFNSVKMMITLEDVIEYLDFTKNQKGHGVIAARQAIINATKG